MITIVDSISGSIEIKGGMLIGIACAVLAVLGAFYVFRGIAIYKLAKKQNYKCAPLSWVPFAWVYVAGKLSRVKNVFGMKIKNFALILVIVFSISQAITLTVALMSYCPLIAYLIEGGEIGINLSSVEGGGFSNVFNQYPLLSGVYLNGAVIKFPNQYLQALNVLNIASLIVEIFYLVFVFTMYFNFFRTYWPQHYFAGFIFSIFGLFPIFAFVVRKREPVDYYEYMKARYGDYMNRRSPYNDPFMNGQGGGFNQGQSQANRDQKPQDPFEEFSNNKTASNNEPFSEFSNSEDPFEEFNDKK